MNETEATQESWVGLLVPAGSRDGRMIYWLDSGTWHVDSGYEHVHGERRCLLVLLAGTGRSAETGLRDGQQSVILGSTLHR